MAEPIPDDRSPDAMPTTRGLNFYLADPNLEFVCSTVMDDATLARLRPQLIELGAIAGNDLDQLAATADRNPPTLRAFDARGVRIDEIVRHPSYRAMEELAFARFGLAAMSHRAGVFDWPGAIPHVGKYALSYLFGQAEFGLLCPVSVTDSTSRMLRHYGDDELKARYLPRLTTTDFDSLWQGTQWMTERTGGSDVGTSTTLARQDSDGSWRLWGDKWFCSNANADAAVTLARPEGAPTGTAGLAMFLVPKILPDGAKNAWTINRLKDKLGSRSMATGEVTYAGAVAYPIGQLDRGFRQMMEMVNVSRLSNAMRAAAIMRRCLLESFTHARARTAFGGPLVALPLLRSALLEMLLDTEAATSVVFNSAAALDRWDSGSADDRALFRILTPLAKYWITQRARSVAGEAMNVRGGNGYIEEWVNARLLRDSHLGAIWEGAANVVALDTQRALRREPGVQDALFRFISVKLASARDRMAMPLVASVRSALEGATTAIERCADLPRASQELHARPIADLLYHALATALLITEAQILLDRSGDYRKLCVAGLYAHRWLTPSTLGAPAFEAKHLAPLEQLFAGDRVERDACALTLLT